jgi:hypothetical protein
MFLSKCLFFRFLTVFNQVVEFSVEKFSLGNINRLTVVRALHVNYIQVKQELLYFGCNQRKSCVKMISFVSFFQPKKYHKVEKKGTRRPSLKMHVFVLHTCLLLQQAETRNTKSKEPGSLVEVIRNQLELSL